MNPSSPDTRAVVRAAEQLTTQLRRIADALTTPVVDTRRASIAAALTAEHYRRAKARIVASPEEHCAAMADAVMRVLTTADDDATTPTTTWTPGPADVAEAVEWTRQAGKASATIEALTANAGCEQHPNAGSVGPYCLACVIVPPPAADAPRCAQCGSSAVVYRNYREQPFCGPCANGERPAPAADEDAPAAVCRRMETRTCPPTYNGPCGPRPCARFESDDPTPWETPATDKDAQRTTRREQLRNLLARADRNTLTPQETAALRVLVDTEVRDADTARRRAEQAEELLDVAHKTSNRSEAARATAVAERDAADRTRAEAQRDRDQHAAVLKEVLAAFVRKVDGYRVPRRSAEVDVVTLDKWRSVVAPTVERPWWEQVAQYEQAAAEATQHVLELKATIERVRALADEYATSDERWRPSARLTGQVFRAALDGTEQPTTEE
ncbi:hypothetical protein ACFW08_20145 [Streptomyces sp. NPDC058960]|uniref:hypothetical protein n=1 Tax=Streptomyces sp. NPDC058960 TaxID=3346679 RepID=UPI0036C837BD